MVLFYVEKVSERLLYTLDFIFSDRKIEYKITNDLLSFKAFTGIKCNYSSVEVSSVYQLTPASLLFDDDIRKYNLGRSSVGETECLIFDGITDPVASVFYILSRMEEYINLKRDKHERFCAKDSILHQNGWLDKLMCERWSSNLITELEIFYNTNIERSELPFSVIPTFDIDNAFAFKWKPLGRQILGEVRDRLQSNKALLQARKKVLRGEEKDPYDTYEYILSIRKRGYEVYLFWLLGDYAKYDKNISSADTRQAELIRDLNKTLKIGLHPSYKSNDAHYILKKEKERLELILKKEVNFSRQHFLKLSIPETYQSLIKLGFKHDFTMGFADEAGFRAGTLRPFKWFDLNDNQVTDYMIHPFAYMDGTLLEYKNWSPAQSKEYIKKMLDEARKFGGDFVCIWHNETIGGFGKWKGWEEILEYTLFHK